ncbi:hypothetical protein [Aestuariibius sp. HNIBRBA575]|uniref:hypothetical protein n=1 Tax=Aestuariibius sp. HNIBRBA575 TaxID=3233343 RepID=UPI0034A432ED
MIRALKRLWAQNKLLVIAFLISASVMVFFGAQTTARWIYWNDPAHQNQTIEGWMTLGYVANSWQVPRPVILEGMHVQRADFNGHPQSLADLAHARGVELDVLIAQITDVIETHRSRVHD